MRRSDALCLSTWSRLAAPRGHQTRSVGTDERDCAEDAKERILQIGPPFGSVTSLVTQASRQQAAGYGAAENPGTSAAALGCPHRTTERDPTRPNAAQRGKTRQNAAKRGKTRQNAAKRGQAFRTCACAL